MMTFKVASGKSSILLFTQLKSPYKLRTLQEGGGSLIPPLKTEMSNLNSLAVPLRSLFSGMDKIIDWSSKQTEFSFRSRREIYESL